MSRPNSRTNKLIFFDGTQRFWTLLSRSRFRCFSKGNRGASKTQTGTLRHPWDWGREWMIEWMQWAGREVSSGAKAWMTLFHASSIRFGYGHARGTQIDALRIDSHKCLKWHKFERALSSSWSFVKAMDFSNPSYEVISPLFTYWSLYCAFHPPPISRDKILG